MLSIVETHAQKCIEQQDKSTVSSNEACAIIDRTTVFTGSSVR